MMRRPAHEERAGDLLRAEVPRQPEGQGHLMLGFKCRMTAREDQSEPIYGAGIAVSLGVLTIAVGVVSFGILGPPGRSAESSRR
jgi:hypothetical protein